MSCPYHILIYGNGLAAAAAAAALRAKLPKAVEITWLEEETAGGPPQTDLFYGSVSAPSSYDFLRGAGLTEPELVLGSDTAFSFGTHYQSWGSAARSWMQSFHIPLPLYGGVGFHHYLARQKKEAEERGAKEEAGKNPLEPYIMPAAAAYKGVFAHPPEGRKIPLASAEYGYQFSPASLTRLIGDRLKAPRINRLSAAVKAVKTRAERGAELIDELALQNGQTLRADLYIDCSGPEAKLLSALGDAPKSTGRRLMAAERFEDCETLGPPRRRLSGHVFGWKSETPLQGRCQHMVVYDPAAQEAALGMLGGPPSARAEIDISRRTAPWQGNCAAIGQSAAAIEPLTPAPFMMLQADISRLLELIPVSADMTIERREYNRRYRDDHSHAALFEAAFFAASDSPGASSYWRAAKASRPESEGKLGAKLTQFKSRGSLVSYDCEPFSQEDWVMLHFGLGHIPARYDPLADRMPSAQIENTLSRMKMAITQMAEKMPPHHVYMTGLLRYLREQK